MGLAGVQDIRSASGGRLDLHLAHVNARGLADQRFIAVVVLPREVTDALDCDIVYPGSRIGVRSVIVVIPCQRKLFAVGKGLAVIGHDRL